MYFNSSDDVQHILKLRGCFLFFFLEGGGVPRPFPEIITQVGLAGRSKKRNVRLRLKILLNIWLRIAPEEHLSREASMEHR